MKCSDADENGVAGIELPQRHNCCGVAVCDVMLSFGIKDDVCKAASVGLIGQLEEDRADSRAEFVCCTFSIVSGPLMASRSL